MKLLLEYTMKSDGIQAPGAIVIRHNPSNLQHPYVVHFRNDQIGGFSEGVYCSTYSEAIESYQRQCRKYDPSGTLKVDSE